MLLLVLVLVVARTADDARLRDFDDAEDVDGAEAVLLRVLGASGLEWRAARAGAELPCGRDGRRLLHESVMESDSRFFMASALAKVDIGE